MKDQAATDAEVVEQAERIARDVLALNAERVDRDGCFPAESVAALRASGLFGLLVPRAYGGLEADPFTFCRIVRTLGRACPSTAMIFNMHCGVARNIALYGPDATRVRFLPGVARGEILLCSIRNEPNASATQGYRGGLQESLIPLPDGGYRYTCRKFFATGSSGADYLSAYGRLVGSEPGQAEQWVLIPRHDPGVEIVENWDTLGMRATRSNYVNFRDCLVRPDAVIGRPGLPIFGDLVVVGQGVVSLAIGESAVDFAVRYLRGEVDEVGVDLAADPHAQREIGELELLLDAARLVFHQACRAIDRGQHERDCAPVVHRAWYHARIVGADVPRRVLALVGGRGTYRRFPLERYLRDGETIALMGPSRASLATGIGKARLGPGPHFESLWLE